MKWVSVVLLVGLALTAGCRREDRVEPEVQVDGERATEPAMDGGPGDERDGQQTLKLSRMEQSIIERVNRIRLDNELEPLEVMPELVRMARDRSEYQMNQRELSHEGEGGTSLQERFEKSGLEYRLAAENVGGSAGYEDPADRIVNGWMDSESHRENILTKGFTHTGVGVVHDPETDAYYVTQLFFAPKLDLF
jgi:uncharacterized protein YkwD